MPATLPAEPLEDRWLDQPRVLSSNVCYCSAARWYARPAWAVRSVVWPIFCHGYKKAELKNERVTFWFFFFSPKPSQILLWEEAAMGRKHETHPPAHGWGTLPSIHQRRGSWHLRAQLQITPQPDKSRGMSETVAWPKASIFNAAVRPIVFPEM